jgi:hypothetical protein
MIVGEALGCSGCLEFSHLCFVFGMDPLLEEGSMEPALS